MAMLEIAGLLVSTVGLLNDLWGTHHDLHTWTEQDLRVDEEWLPLAIEKGILPGPEEQYMWSWATHVATRELKGTHQVVVALNEERKIKYRIVQGPESFLILTRIVEPAN